VKTIHKFINKAKALRLQAKIKLIGLTAAALSLVMFSTGCAHQLTVKNLSTYQNTNASPLKKPLTIGIIPDAEGKDCQQLITGVGMALGGGNYSATVIRPYLPQSSSDKRADVVATIKVASEYAGSGWNFLINWPGFLIFTPAWNGYVYKANYQVGIVLAKGADDAPIDSWEMPIHLNLRQAEIDRTWTEIGWLEFGVIPLIGGIVFTGYDTDVTDPLVQKIEMPIGDYIAQEIVNRVNQCDSLFVPPKPAKTPVVSPPIAPTPVEPPKETPAASPPTTNAITPSEPTTTTPPATNAVSSSEAPVTSPSETNAASSPAPPAANPSETNVETPPASNAANPQNQ
jgi:hypothetical protein